MKITLHPHVLDQQQIKVYGRRVGYCGIHPNMPICFLTDAKNQCGLSPEEKTEVIRYVIDVMGSAKKTAQTAKFWPKPQSKEIVAHEQDA